MSPGPTFHHTFWFPLLSSKNNTIRGQNHSRMTSVPRSTKELRSFLGFASFHQNLFPGFADIFSLFNDLSGKKLPSHRQLQHTIPLGSPYFPNQFYPQNQHTYNRIHMQMHQMWVWVLYSQPPRAGSTGLGNPECFA